MTKTRKESNEEKGRGAKRTNAANQEQLTYTDGRKMNRDVKATTLPGDDIFQTRTFRGKDLLRNKLNDHYNRLKS